MPWVEENAAPAAAPNAAGQWVEEGAAPPAVQPDMAWYEQFARSIGSGLQHRLDTERARELYATEHPIESALSNPFRALMPSLSRPNTAVGPGEQAALAARASDDAAAKAQGLGQGISGALGQGLGETPEAVIMPGMRFGGTGILSKLARAAVNGGVQGAYGASVNDRDVAQAAGLGAAGGVVGAGVGTLAGKAANALRGTWADAGLQSADAAARSLGVQPRIGDLAPEGAFRKFEDAAKFIPGSGAPAALRDQAQALAGSVQGLQDEMAAPLAAHLNAGRTPEELVAESARRQLAAHNDVVTQLAAAVPKNVEVKPEAFIPAMKHLATEYPDLLANVDAPMSIRSKISALIDPPVVEPPPLSADDLGALQFVQGKAAVPAERERLLEQLSPGITDRIKAQQAGPQPGAPPTLTAGEAHWIQSGLGDMQRALDKQTAMGNSLGSAGKFVGQARDALLGDMDKTEAVSAPFAAMRSYFRQNVVPYRDNPLLRGLVEPDATGDRLFTKLAADDVGKAKELMGALDPVGQAALRYGAIARAGNSAVTDNLESGISTAKLSKAFDVGDMMGQKRSLAEIFTPEQQSKIAAIRDAAQLARRSATWAHNPHTGAQNIPVNLGKAAAAAIGGHAVGLSAPAAILGPVAAARAVTALSKSQAAKNFYFAPGSDRASNIARALAAQAAASGADEKQPSILDYLGAGM